MGCGLFEFGGNFVIQTITNFFLCNDYVLPQEAMYVKGSLENSIPLKGVVSEEGLRHEYDCPAS